MKPSDIFEAYKKGDSPRSGVYTDDEGRVNKIVSLSQRNDTVIAKHVDGGEYKVMRIEPEYQSRHDAMMDSIKNPNPSTSFSKDFEDCSYQLLTFSAPEFRNPSASVRANDIHRKCHWNSRGTSRKRKARSSRKIQEAWDKFAI